jgi:hypothetical protein
MVKLYKKIPSNATEYEFKNIIIDCAKNQINMEVGFDKKGPGLFMEIGEAVSFDGQLLIKVNGGKT